VKKWSFFIFSIMAKSTERQLYDDLRAITDWQTSKFLLYFDSSCIVITRSRKLARVITSKSVVKNSVLPTAAIMRLSEGIVFIYFPIARPFVLSWMTSNLRVSSTWKQAQYLRLVLYNPLQLSCYLVKLLSALLFLTLYCNFINTLYKIMA
jgi:hypothetical protein